MAKLERYIKGQINRKRYHLEQEQQRQLDALPTETLLQRYKMLTGLMLHARKLGKKEQPAAKTATVESVKAAFPRI